MNRLCLCRRQESAMSILLTFLIAVTVNLDNFLIGMNLGIRGQKLTIKSNLIIGLFTGGCAFLFTMAARMLTGTFVAYTNLFGAAIMILFGIYCLISEFLKREEDTALSIVTLKDTCILGIVLAINCIPPSFSAGITGLNPFSMGLFSALFSFLSMYLSNRLGESLIRYRFFRFLTPVSSVLLILIGVGELFL